AALFRPEFDTDWDAGGPDRDGRLFPVSHAALGTSAAHALDRHHPSHAHDLLVWQPWPQGLAHFEPSHLESPVALCRGPAFTVHQRPEPHGRLRQSPL